MALILDLMTLPGIKSGPVSDFSLANLAWGDVRIHHLVLPALIVVRVFAAGVFVVVVVECGHWRGALRIILVVLWRKLRFLLVLLAV